MARELPPERFELIGCYSGPDHSTPNGTLHGEVFLARNVPVDKLAVTEGRLEIVAINELDAFANCLPLPRPTRSGSF
jgi:hypothetical protein